MSATKSSIGKAIKRIELLLANKRLGETQRKTREAQLASLKERYDNYGIVVNGKANDGVLKEEKTAVDAPKKVKYTIDRVLGVKKFEDGTEKMLTDDEIELLDLGKGEK